MGRGIRTLTCLQKPHFDLSPSLAPVRQIDATPMVVDEED